MGAVSAWGASEAKAAGRGREGRGAHGQLRARLLRHLVPERELDGACGGVEQRELALLQLHVVLLAHHGAHLAHVCHHAQHVQQRLGAEALRQLVQRHELEVGVRHNHLRVRAQLHPRRLVQRQLVGEGAGGVLFVGRPQLAVGDVVGLRSTAAAQRVSALCRTAARSHAPCRPRTRRGGCPPPRATRWPG